MKKTLSQVVKDFETFATNHKIIKSFNTKPVTDLVAKNLSYPTMWVQSGDVEITTGEMAINLNILFLDRLKRDYSNTVQVMSDTLQLVEDFYTIYNDNQEKYGYFVDDSATASAVVIEYDDILSGFEVPLKVVVGLGRNENQVPLR